MRIYDLIEKKKHGGMLTREEIHEMVAGYVDGRIPDYQMSAMLMAIWFRGMNEQETTDLTIEMELSGETVDLTSIPGFKVDKHSTGGVGDKTTLIVGPMVAACGGTVAKMSGRGLGHTGGTLDKLESIPGFRTSLTQEEFFSQVRDIGIAVIGQTANLVPADKKMYALRDVTATVDCIPLIASSVMSKKLAAGSDGILLDVKTGSGAFMKTPAEAKELARQMVEIGTLAGRRTEALITNMDIPLGCNIGNALEVREAIEVLRGDGPSDLRSECILLASRMLVISGIVSEENAREMAENSLKDRSALEKFREMIAAQGGDPLVCDDLDRLPTAAVRYELKSEVDGVICRMDTEGIGISSMLLGAGREKQGDSLDFSAGIQIYKKTGDSVVAGETIAVLYTTEPDRIAAAEKKYRSSVEMGAEMIEKAPLIYGHITSSCH